MLSIRRQYADAEVLFGSDLDAICDDIETFLNVTKLNDDNIQDQGITASTKLVDGSVTAGKLASSAVTTPKIADAAVTLAKMAADSVDRPQILAAERMPTGAMLEFAGSAAPTGYLLCDGSSLSRTSYPALFAVIGTTYGNVDGFTFNVPDRRGRVGVGVGTGSGLTARTLGDKFGEETHVLSESEMPTHTHTQSAHNHSVPIRDGGSGFFAPDASFNRTGATTDSNYPVATSSATPAIQATGGSAAHNNVQPSIALNYIIKF